MSDIPLSSNILRTAVHPSITGEQISDLVNQFYRQIFLHARLGPIFLDNISGDRGDHLEKMKRFWRSVLLRTGEYKGKPVPAHQKIDGILMSDFEDWLALFADVSAKVFEPEAAGLVNEAARRIATSLWLSRSADPFATPPVWSHAGESRQQNSN